MNAEERMKVLKMLEEGKIKADEAARLLEAMGEGPGAEGAAGAAGAAGAPRAKSIHVRVYKADSDRARVNVHVPLSLAKWALKFGGKHADAHVGAKEIDLDEISAFLDQPPGEVLTVEDEDSGERVEITLK